MICLCLTGDTLESWSAELERNRARIALVELRVDLLRPAERSVEAIAAWWSSTGSGISCILTVRRQRDGGRWEGDDGQRLFLLARLAEALKPAYLDVELDRQSHADWSQLVRRQEDRGGQVIRSYHGPNPGREELSQLVARLAAGMHEIPKLAIDPRGLGDVVAVVEAARAFRRYHGSRRGIWLAMGELGLPTRVLPAHLGSAWTYASDPPPDAVRAAPGQLDIPRLLEQYRVSESRPDWRVFAVVGSPIAHSASPAYHNRRLAELGLPGVYVPVRADDFGVFMDLAELLDIRGVSVTVPHKETALAAGDASPRARAVGAANTLIRGADGWRSDNTDVDGFMGPLQQLAGDGAGRRAAVIGAGGAARAVVVGLRDAGWQVEVYNRSPERATALMASIGMDTERAHPMSALRECSPGSFDLLVQTTPLGMLHGEQADPAAGYDFEGSELVYDIIYTPPETPLLARARAAGCRTLNGEGMFAAQAAAQFEQFRALL